MLCLTEITLKDGIGFTNTLNERSNMTKLYVAEFSRHGTASLARVELVKETPKTYVVDRTTYEKLLGYSYGNKQLLKANHNCFLTAEEAIGYLLGKINKYLIELESQIESKKK